MLHYLLHAGSPGERLPAMIAVYPAVAAAANYVSNQASMPPGSPEASRRARLDA